MNTKQTIEVTRKCNDHQVEVKITTPGATVLPVNYRAYSLGELSVAARTSPNREGWQAALEQAQRMLG